MNKYTIKDLLKVLNYMQDKVKAAVVGIEIDQDNGRLKVSSFDPSSQHIVITVYRSGKDDEATLMPEITETRKL